VVALTQSPYRTMLAGSRIEVVDSMSVTTRRRADSARSNAAASSALGERGAECC
jgi:hypothetical protein